MANIFCLIQTLLIQAGISLTTFQGSVKGLVIRFNELQSMATVPIQPDGISP